MKAKLKTKLMLTSLALLMAIPVTAGCQAQNEPQVTAPAIGALSSTMVPNMDLDVYVYVNQESPTTVPAGMVKAPIDVEVESLAIWGVSTESAFAFGGALTLTSASQAGKIHAQIAPRSDVWANLSNRTIYLVYGSGTAAESLRKAITSNDFKRYDDSQGLSAVAALPDGDTTRLAGVAIVKPSKTLISHLSRDADSEGLEMVNTILSLTRLDVIAAGLYAPGQIDIAKLASTMENKGDITQLDLGILVLLKSGLPGFIVEPAVKKFLAEAEFREATSGDLTLYQRSLDTDGGQTIPVLVRVDGNRVFGALSGKESYARTLLTSVK